MGERIGLSDGGMMGIARTGAQWRHPPEEYGTWNSVFRRYRRRATAGVFDAMLETLASVVERDGRATRSTARSSGHTIVPWALKKGLAHPSGSDLPHVRCAARYHVFCRIRQGGTRLAAAAESRRKYRQRDRAGRSGLIRQ
ncbi:transposase [Sphingomonas hankookensis]|uniref:transposase n=1 Tax=Sphingomonas hankookensis TaxID=563996 RepID=UPI003D30363C